MTENQNKAKSNGGITPDWLVRGVLTKVGDLFDRLTGRKWQPSSSLATSELIEKLKQLLDADVEDLGMKGRFVPHNIKLKMQWDKFSADADNALKKLETELLAAAVDHLNDHHYHTFAPLRIEVKTDYFTEGVKLSASFDNATTEEEREVAVNVSVPDLKQPAVAAAAPALLPEARVYTAEFLLGDQPRQVRLSFQSGLRLSVGRSRENSLSVEDPSVSKVHASLFVNADQQLALADTGSTNGTFINDERISYGKAYPLSPADKVKFGTVEVTFKEAPRPPAPIVAEAPAENRNSIQVGEFEFFNSKPQHRVEQIVPADEIKAAETESLAVLTPPAAPLTERGIVLDYPKDE